MIRLAVRVRREDAELVLAELIGLVPSGLEETELEGDVVEYGLYGAPGELPTLPDLRAAAGAALVEISTAEVADDWRERWRAYHRPLVLGDRLTVRPPWEEPGRTAVDVVIDPGQAFGTGAHATTRLCLELMLAMDPSGVFVDLGCGSGVLAITAAKLGYAPVLALDNDPAALAAARTNADANAVTVDVRSFDLRSAALPPWESGGARASTVAANLLAPLLQVWAQKLVEPPDRAIAGGLLSEEAEAVAAAFASSGLQEKRRLEYGGWTALLLERDYGHPRIVESSTSRS